MISKLKKDLNVEEITNLCNNIYYYMKNEEDDPITYIEYRIINCIDSDFAGNKNMTEIYTIQIDIFSYGDYKELAKIIKDTLKGKDYVYTEGQDLYENDTRLYHKVLRFKYKLFV